MNIMFQKLRTGNEDGMERSLVLYVCVVCSGMLDGKEKTDSGIIATDSSCKVCWVVATDSGGKVCWVVATDCGGKVYWVEQQTVVVLLL